MIHVIKSSGTSEEYVAAKQQLSIVKSLLAVHEEPGTTERIAAAVMDRVTLWLANKHEVTSLDLRTVSANELAKHNKDAAVVYKKYKDIW